MSVVEPARWSVTTWNVHGSARPPIDRLAIAIATQTPDVVAIQEIRSSQARALAAALDMEAGWTRKHFPYTRIMFHTAEGMAILSPHRLGPIDSAELSLGRSSSSYRRRIVQWADITREDGARLRVYNAHLASGQDVYERRAQAARLTSVITKHGSDLPFVIAGDLNDDADVAVVAALPAVEHITPTPSNPSGAPSQSLDHVLLPADAGDVSSSIPAGGADWAELSDHLPVTVRFALATASRSGTTSSSPRRPT
jgi:endonuclease/exonuclease/phosphatase family metal-dependent hydrolase